ncbi:MAG: hypothetical protein RL216_970 [Pseudomonadota bacterium]|jgi:hypothetical protein
MAQRYGGKYSPDPARRPDGAQEPLPPVSPFDGKRPRRAAARVNLLFLAALVLLAPAFGGGADATLPALGGAGLILCSAWLTREGERAHQAYDARRVARRPAFPRKIFGSVLCGAGVGLAASISQSGLAPLGFALAGAVLHLLSFGPDPMRDKGAEGIDSFQTDRVARAVDEAEKLLEGMRDAILRAGDRQLEARVERFAATAQAMFRGVESDPRDLTAARKYLSVYLTGARDATVKFADLYRQNRDGAVRAEYVALLDDLETNFARRTQTLLSDNRTDLDVEISVLRERLGREG